MVKKLRDILREAVVSKNFLVMDKDPHHLKGLEHQMYQIVDILQGNGGQTACCIEYKDGRRETRNLCYLIDSSVSIDESDSWELKKK